MTQAFGDIRSGLVLLMALAVSGAGWWLVVAEPAALPGFICGVAGYETAGLLGRVVMWLAMMLAMALPVGVAIGMRAGRVPDAAFLAGYGGAAAGVAVVAAVVEWMAVSSGLGSGAMGSVSGTVAGATFMSLGLLNLAATVFRRSTSCMSDDELERKSPPKSSPQGGGLNLAAPAWPTGGERVPRVVSPLVGGEQRSVKRSNRSSGSIAAANAGRPKRVFLCGLSRGQGSIFCPLTMAGLQLILGTMSPLLMLAMTLWMLAEALFPERRELPMALGAALIMAGLSVIAATSVT